MPMRRLDVQICEHDFELLVRRREASGAGLAELVRRAIRLTYGNNTPRVETRTQEDAHGDAR